MGKIGGSVHRSDIRACCMDIKGEWAATCGEDKRIIIWDLQKWKANKYYMLSRVIEGHKGTIHQVEFTADAENLISSSDDGKVLIWNWRTGTVLNSSMRHPAAVKSFDFNFDKPELIVCGRNDGAFTVWNTQDSIKIDEILPDPSWVTVDVENNIYIDKEKNHCGIK